jgi:hypothetical protein
MAMPLESAIMEYIGLGAYFDWHNGSGGCGDTRRSAAGKLGPAIQYFHDIGKGESLEQYSQINPWKLRELCSAIDRLAYLQNDSPDKLFDDLRLISPVWEDASKTGWVVIATPEKEEAFARVITFLREHSIIASPDKGLVELVQLVAREGDHDEYTLTKTWQAASYVIAEHIHQARTSPKKRELAYTNIGGHIANQLCFGLGQHLQMMAQMSLHSGLSELSERELRSLPSSELLRRIGLTQA